MAATTREIDPHRLRAAEWRHLPVLQDPEELRLLGERELRDLVEEERAAGGLLQEAGLRLDGSRERPLAVAEEGALEQRLGNGGTVDRDERSTRPPTAVVDGAGGELLPRSRGTGDEHRRAHLGRLAQRATRLAHRGASPMSRSAEKRPCTARRKPSTSRWSSTSRATFRSTAATVSTLKGFTT